MPEQLFEDQITYVIGHAEDKVLFIYADLLSIIEAIHHRLTTVETYFIMTDKATLPLTSLPNVYSYKDLIHEEKTAYEFPNFSE